MFFWVIWLPLRLAHKSSFWARSASERKLVPGPTTPDQKTKRTTLRKSNSRCLSHKYSFDFKFLITDVFISDKGFLTFIQNIWVRFFENFFLYAYVNTCVAIAVSKQALHEAHWEVADCAPLVLPREAIKVQIWITYSNFRYFYIIVTMDNRKTGCLSIIHAVTISGLRVQGAILVAMTKATPSPPL